MDSLKAVPQQESRLHFLDYWRIIRIRKTVILAVFLLVFVTATIVTFILPEQFAATSRIKVTKTSPDIAGVQTPENQGGYDPYFTQTEFEIMKSADVLDRVIDRLNLNTVWGHKYNGGDSVMKTADTEGILRGRLSLNPVRNTLLIDITVYSDKPQEAADLANAVADAYSEKRTEDFNKLQNRGVAALKEQYAEQEKKISDQSTNVEALRKLYNIPDSDPNSTGPGSSLEMGVVQEIQSELNTFEVQYEQLGTNLATLSGMDKKKLRTVLPRAVENPDSQLMSLLDQLNLAEQSFLQVQANTKPENPTYQSAYAAVTNLNDKIDTCVDGIMVGMQTKLASYKAVVDSQRAKLKAAKDMDIARAEETRPYYDAKDQLERSKNFLKILDMKILSTAADATLPMTAVVQSIETAKPDPTPVRPKKTLNIILGIVIGLVVGVGLAFFIEYLDTSVKTIDDVERALQAPVLGVIPQNVGVLLQEGAESPHAEAYRVLRTNLLFSRKDDKLNTVCVVSAGAGEGKSTTILNLATAFAQSGDRVLLVDSDLRRPTLHKMLKLSNSLGLTNCLLKQNTLEEVIQRTSLPSLDLLPSGKLPSSSLSILSSAQMRELITELKRRYDFVFFDSPPIMGVSDASVLASEVDMTVQVIQYRRYPQPMNIRAKQMVEKVGGNLIGIVLNNINMSQDESYYYYSGYYHGYYYYSRDEDQVPASETGATGAAGDKPADKPAEIKQKY